MFWITDKGLKYLDRVLGSSIEGGSESERKARILSLVEYLGGSATFDDLWESNRTITYLRYPGYEYLRGQPSKWAAPGTERDFVRTIERLVEGEYLREDKEGV